MLEISPESPEARRKRLAKAKARFGTHPRELSAPAPASCEVIKRVAIGVYSDGFIHAGNLAYLALLSLFPFVIVAAAIARLFGQTEEGMNAVNALLADHAARTSPTVLRTPIRDVIEARSGSLLWLGAIVGLWTTGSFIETIRDIIRRAYGVSYSRPFWEYRLGSVGMIIAAVIIAMIAFALSVLLSGVQEFVVELIPGRRRSGRPADLVRRSCPALVLFGSLYLLFYVLTPKRYRISELPEMARRRLRRGLVGGDHRPAAARAGQPRRLRPHLWQPRRRDHRPDFLLHDRARPGDRRRAERGACGDAGAQPKRMSRRWCTRKRPHEAEHEGRSRRPCRASEQEERMTGLMQGKRGLIMGLANDRSLAWGIAKALADAGRRAGFLLSGRGAGEAGAAARRAAWAPTS